MADVTLRGILFCFAWGVASAGDALPPPATPTVISDWDGEGRQKFLLETASASQRSVWVVGEVHGTNEAQALVRDMLVARLSEGPTILALEIPQRSQASIDAYMSSDGSPGAVDSLVSNDFWAGGSDGRNTLAMLRLVEAARHLKTTGARLRVLCFDPASGGGAAARDAGMAKHIQDALSAAPGSHAVVLVGNYHSRPISSAEASDGAANLVSALQTPSFVVNLLPARGAYWACLREGCGPHTVKKVASSQGLLAAEYTPLDGRGPHTFARLVLPQFTPSFPVVEALGLKQQ